MHHMASSDPAETLIAWEAVEEMLGVVPEGLSKDVLRLTAAGLDVAEIAERLDLERAQVEAFAARGRIRVLTAAVAASAAARPACG